MTDPQPPERIQPEEPEMTPSPPQQVAAEPFDDYDDSFGDDLPQRPRASYLTPLTALLMALILGGVGFYVGIRVEKSDTGSTATGSSAFARALASGAGGAGGTSSAGKAGSTSRTSGFSGAGGFASRFAGLGGAGAGTAGSIASVSGNTIYVTEASGNTVKVKLSSATKISKSETVSKKKLYPGEEVVVAGSAASNGTVHATSVTDSGVTASSSTSSSSSSSSTNSSSGISSLFGGG